MVLLLLLGACICVGLSDDTRTLALFYGDRYSLKLDRNAETLEFIPLHDPYQHILWKKDDPGVSEASRGRVVGNVLWVMDKLTQEDSGHYTVRGKDKLMLYTKTILVSEHTKSYEMMVGEHLNFSFNLAPAQCDLTFFPVDGESYKVVRAGSIVDHLFDGRIQLLSSSRFRFLIERIKTWDHGRFELTDEKGNLALVVQLKVLVPAPLSFYASLAVAALFVVCLCRGCVKSCCGASSSRTDDSGSQTAATPDVFNHEDITQPTGPPSDPSIGPLVAARGRQGVAPSASHGPASDPEPRFELKGPNLPWAPPLSSDSTHCDVYTSDKINFL